MAGLGDYRLDVHDLCLIVGLVGANGSARWLVLRLGNYGIGARDRTRANDWVWSHDAGRSRGSVLGHPAGTDVAARSDRHWLSVARPTRHIVVERVKNHN